MNKVYYDIIKRKIDLFLSTFVTESESIFKENNKLVHPGEYGMYRERCLRELLKSIIPEKYKIGDGFVINVNGERSKQCDILIYDPSVIPVTDNEIARFYPEEGIKAIGEVKSTLSKQDLSEALYKMALNKMLFSKREIRSTDKTKKKLNQIYPNAFLICKNIACKDLNEMNEDFFKKTYQEIPRCFWHNGILSLEDGVVWYKIKVDQISEKGDGRISASWSQPIINNENLEVQVVKAREDFYYHIMTFFSKLRDDVDYVENFEFPMLEYLGMNNVAFEDALK